MKFQSLLRESSHATAQIATDLTCVIEQPEILTSIGCPPELAGCTYPIVQLLHRQTLNVIQIQRSLILLGTKSTNEFEPSIASPINIVRKRLDDILEVAVTQFYAVPFAEVKDGWRRIYADTRILMFHLKLVSSLFHPDDSYLNHGRANELSDDDVNELVTLLDMAIIVAGGNPVKSRDKQWMNNILSLLEQSITGGESLTEPQDQNPPHATKKIHPEDDNANPWLHYPSFSTAEPFTPSVRNPIPHISDFTLDAFQAFLSGTSPDNIIPVIFPDLVSHWPALTSRPWCKPAYLQHSTFGGRRLVPIEIGRSYIDSDWGQKLLSFDKFLTSYITLTGQGAKSDESDEDDGHRRGYLAQYDLLAQVPSLRADVGIPDLCWAEPPLATAGSPGPKFHSEPRLNAWFGPAQTITPLHTDSTHNILVQVVGRKYVRLYHPRYTSVLQPMKPQNGIDMSNTAEIDVGVEERWDNSIKSSTLDEPSKQAFNNAEYWDCILEPGDSLYIPYGWWHYVRSLSISFSVSFWWT